MTRRQHAIQRDTRNGTDRSHQIAGHEGTFYWGNLSSTRCFPSTRTRCSSSSSRDDIMKVSLNKNLCCNNLCSQQRADTMNTYYILFHIDNSQPARKLAALPIFRNYQIHPPWVHFNRLAGSIYPPLHDAIHQTICMVLKSSVSRGDFLKNITMHKKGSCSSTVVYEIIFIHHNNFPLLIRKAQSAHPPTSLARKSLL